MAEPETTRNRRQGADSYDSSADGEQKMASKVGVYDRPANAGQRGGGMNMMTILIAVIVLLVLGAIVWRVLM